MCHVLRTKETPEVPGVHRFCGIVTAPLLFEEEPSVRIARTSTWFAFHRRILSGAGPAVGPGVGPGAGLGAGPGAGQHESGVFTQTARHQDFGVITDWTFFMLSIGHHVKFDAHASTF